MSFLRSHCIAPTDEDVYSDASGSWGYGAIWRSSWLQCPWGDVWEGMNIAAKELLPIVLAVGIWGEDWRHRHIQVFCDNGAIVEVFKSCTSHHKTIMHLHFLEAYWDFTLRVRHIPGAKNIAADAISRNSMQVFRRAAPEAEKKPTEIPRPLWEILTDNIDWTSPLWKPRLMSYLRVVSHHPQRGCTRQERKPS